MQLVDTGSGPRRFAQVWRDGPDGAWLVRHGTVGRAAEAETQDASQTQESLVRRWTEAGYRPVTEDDLTSVVVQWPLASLTGTRRDTWLLDLAEEQVGAHLDTRGLGHVDGHDRGRRSGPDGGFVMNLFCAVLDQEKGATAVMGCLRSERLDATRATVAVRDPETGSYAVRYARRSGVLPGDFSL